MSLLKLAQLQNIEANKLKRYKLIWRSLHLLVEHFFDVHENSIF